MCAQRQRSADLARSVQTGPLGSLQCIHLEAPADAPTLPCWETADPIAMDTRHTMTWACARQARDYLGVSEKTLARWRDSGLLKPGKHWRRKFPTGNSPVLYHLQLCEEAMGEATARTASRQERALVTGKRHAQRSWPQGRA